MSIKHGPGWRWNDDWRRIALMDWLCTLPAERPSRAELCSRLKVAERTLLEWQNEPQFLAAWQTRSAEITGTDRTKTVLDALYTAAIDPANRNHVTAARLFLEATNAITPPPLKVEVIRPEDLSDEELDALLASKAKALRAVSSD